MANVGKTLSKGTLGLRFMQNAQRAKLQEQVELEHAKVKDDAEWEVSQAVKDAWGIGQDHQRPRPAAVHEASYVPFLFSEDAEPSASGSQSKLRGRRTFNARGEEVLESATTAEPTREDGDDAKDAGDAGTVKREKRPSTISGFRHPIASTQPDPKRKARTKTAQELIREDPPPTVKAEPPSSDSARVARGIPLSAGFVKPAGVDEPARKVKRERKPDGAEAEGKRRKKTKVEDEAGS